MKRFIRNCRGMVVGAGLVGLALVAGVGLGPHMGFTAGPETPVWTEPAVPAPPTQRARPERAGLPQGRRVDAAGGGERATAARPLRRRGSVRAVLPTVR